MGFYQQKNALKVKAEMSEATIIILVAMLGIVIPLFAYILGKMYGGIKKPKGES